MSAQNRVVSGSPKKAPHMETLQWQVGDDGWYPCSAITAKSGHNPSSQCREEDAMRGEPSHVVTIRVVPREQKNEALVPSIVMTEGRGLFYCPVLSLAIDS
jgi:hypothetical protein